MNVAIIHRRTDGEPGVLITDHGDRYLIEHLRELAVRPDASAPVPVTLSTGGIWEIGGDTVLDAFAVSTDVTVAEVLAAYRNEAEASS
ncbi:hypothetical protein ACQP2Y_21265 [Actinoplanes sp. CA-051413]|uniref:hypothetical protein n=1 Tax=Actinoplanes sp. CA-051413 TaxID=3239899 RepID=UPI003D9868E5